MECSLGLALEVSFDTKPESEWYGIENSLEKIRDSGIERIEFAISPATTEKEIYLKLDRCLAQDLKVNLHPYTDGKYAPGSFELKEGNLALKQNRYFLELAHRISKIQKEKVTVVFHPASNSGMEGLPWEKEERDFFKKRSNEFFRWVDAYVKDKEFDVLVVSEFSLPSYLENGFFRIGDTYEEIVETVEGTNVGICWDTGHTYISHLHNGESLLPPDYFLKKVKYMHLHDYYHGKDHHPILYDNVPIRDYLFLLKKAGFSGGITFEPNTCGMRLAVYSSGSNPETIVKRCVEKFSKLLEET